MSARFSRSVFASLRASARSRVNYGLPGRRNMSAQSHGAQPQKSDMPWVVGAAVVFGPMFLYLVSPSARKSQKEHAVHHDHHDFPTLGKEAPSHSQSEPQKEGTELPEVMKDDEGTPADVTATIALSEESDVPKDSQSPETVAETTIAAEQAPVGEEALKEADKEDPANETPAPAEPANAEAPAVTPEKTKA
ncbi:hypothetical protein AN958_06957 [Leucoagaricus sp. SymC.cos]|nr:hypothetical protein AN958_06957 [Leucoagaricus sp. SymC.cos]